MDLSIILINYKTKEITADCLNTIKKSTDKLKKEIIVVDNQSEDGSVEYLKKKFPKLKIYPSGGNLGFAGGNNFGFKKAKGEYIWLLNSDTLLKPTTIQKLFKATLQNNSQISSCRILNSDGSIQPQGGALPKLCNLFYWMFFIDDIPLFRNLLKPYHQDNRNYFKKDQHPGWLSGTALLIKSDLYKKLEGLDKKIFMYGEDTEFCLRASLMGVKIDYFSKPSLTHLGQGSGSSKGAILGEYRGLKYIYKKHQPAWKHLVLRLLLKTGALLRIIIFGIIFKDETKKDIYKEAFKLA